MIRKLIAKFHERAPRVFCGIRRMDAVMKVNLHFAPAGPAMFCELLDDASIILLGRIEVGMDKRPPILVSPAVHQRIFSAPLFEAFFLRVTASVLSWRVRKDRWLKMIRQSDDQMRRPSVFGAARRLLPEVSRQPPHRNRN